MRANPHRGEVAATLCGVPVRLRLTLGALAEIEEALALDTATLADRLAEGRLGARAAVVILAAAARAGGAPEVTEEALAAADIEGGPAGAFRLVAALFAAAFAGPQEGA